MDITADSRSGVFQHVQTNNSQTACPWRHVEFIEIVQALLNTSLDSVYQPILRRRESTNHQSCACHNYPHAVVMPWRHHIAALPPTERAGSQIVSPDKCTLYRRARPRPSLEKTHRFSRYVPMILYYETTFSLPQCTQLRGSEIRHKSCKTKKPASSYLYEEVS